MIVVLDGTPLLGKRTGIGTYTENLVHALARRPEVAAGDLTLKVVTFSARARKIANLPHGVRQIGASLPARALRAAWLHSAFPPAEVLVGRCDVFHGTNFVTPPTLRAGAVVTIHDLTYEYLPETVTPDVLEYRALVARALSRGARVVTPSETVASQVRSHYGLESGRVRATPLGVDSSWSTATPLSSAALARLGLPDRYLLFVGSLDPRKNLDALITAHARARASQPDLPPLVLAGPAGRSEGKSRPGVVQTGWLEDETLRGVVAASTALILPSLDEGFGLPVIEALACGRPVLASDLPVLREVAGTHAVFAPPTVDGLVDGLLRLSVAFNDSEAQESRRAWAARFTWDATAEATLSTYREAAR